MFKAAHLAAKAPAATGDIFSILPPEMLSNIVHFTDAGTYLALKLSNKAFAADAFLNLSDRIKTDSPMATRHDHRRFLIDAHRSLELARRYSGLRHQSSTPFCTWCGQTKSHQSFVDSQTRRLRLTITDEGIQQPGAKFDRYCISCVFASDTPYTVRDSVLLNKKKHFACYVCEKFYLCVDKQIWSVPIHNLPRPKNPYFLQVKHRHPSDVRPARNIIITERLSRVNFCTSCAAVVLARRPSHAEIDQLRAQT